MTKINEPRRVTFCPIPSISKPEISPVQIGQVRGIIAWQYPNGDAIVRTEDSFWYMPQGTFKQV